MLNDEGLDSFEDEDEDEFSDEAEEDEADDIKPGRQLDAEGKPLRLAGRNVDLQPPRSYSERYDVLALDYPHQKAAAALGVCWPALRRFLCTRRNVDYDGDPKRYAKAVIDFLTEEGTPMTLILRAGTRAIILCARGLPTLSGIEAAEGNSGPPTASSTAK